MSTQIEEAFFTAETWQSEAGRPVRQPRDRSWTVVAAISGGTLAYATLRYNVFKGVPWADWPGYTLNKALAFSALILIALAVVRIGAGRRTAIVMASAGALALAHSLLSFALLNPLYFPKFYLDGKLTFAAGLSLAIGVAATAAMDVGARRSATWPANLRHAAIALIAFATGIHAAIPGFAGWIAPATWPGSLPPITLLSFLCGSAAAIVWARYARRGRRAS